MIRTGISKLDDFFSGEVPDGILIDVFGSNGTGKTQLAIQIAIHTISQNNSILFLDTTGAFRPERMVEIIQENNLNKKILDQIIISRVTNVSEQMESFLKIDPSKFSLIIIDNISDLFSFEYSNENQFLEKNKLFLKYMKNISIFAIENNITILLTNVMRNKDDKQIENLEKIVDMMTHVKIKLEKINNNYNCKCYTAFDNIEFNFKFTPLGLVEIS